LNVSYFSSLAPVKYFKRCLGIFNKKDKIRLLLLTALQVLAGFLDLLGVGLIGVLGALGVSGIQSRQPGDRVSFVLDTLRLETLTFQQQALALAGSATAILTIRTVISVFLTRKTLNFLSNRAASMSSSLASKILNSELTYVKSSSSQEILYRLTTGVGIIVLGVVGTVVSLFSDLALLLVITAGLFIVDPSVAISTLVLFGGIGFTLYRMVSSRARRAGADNMKLSIASSQIILEALDSYRVALVRNRRSHYVREISQSRFNLAKIQADLQFIPSITKYVIESVMLFGILLITGIQFALKDAVHATATMALFMAASSRIAPAVMRIQQAAVQIRSNAGAAYTTLDLFEELFDAPTVSQHSVDVPSRVDFNPEIVVKDVSVTFENLQFDVLANVSLNFKPGTLTAIVGPSGAGKSTLLDAILGIKKLKNGEVLISGQPPLDTFSKWPTQVGFVPQETYLRKGSIRENVALGYSSAEIDDESVLAALERAQLSDFVSGFPEGIYSEIGESGSTISGGQRQRLGIARALYTNPKIIILDEATSALDALTEQAITSAIKELKGSVTLIVVAHRLSTIQDADTVVYMADGRVLSTGSFEEVRKSVPDFEEQAQVMGL
jgi:ABC-type multidrug transport system fused ATPase/permease subunit